MLTQRFSQKLWVYFLREIVPSSFLRSTQFGNKVKRLASYEYGKHAQDIENWSLCFQTDRVIDQTISGVSCNHSYRAPVHVAHASDIQKSYHLEVIDATVFPAKVSKSAQHHQRKVHKAERTNEKDRASSKRVQSQTVCQKKDLLTQHRHRPPRRHLRHRSTVQRCNPRLLHRPLETPHQLPPRLPPLPPPLTEFVYQRLVSRF